MDVEFIKWMCEKVEGFKVDSYCGNYILECPDYEWYILDPPPKRTHFKHIYYPFLLQRATEGANKFHVGGFKITIRDFDIIVQDYITSEIGRIFAVNPDIDQAKESALKYIYEQEIKENK